MKKVILLTLFTVLLLFAFNPFLYAQTKDNYPTEKIDGSKYYIHTVEQGHTLYAISKQYAIPIADIVAANPEAEKGLIIGQILKIPIKKIDKKESKNNPSVIQGNFLLHRIQQGETLYAISKKYEVTIDDILKDNPTANENLHIGDTLKIAVSNIQNTEEVDIAPAITDTLINHLVKEEETLYSLAKLYNVNIDSIAIVNFGLPNGLQVGQSIRIPKLLPEIIASRQLPDKEKVFLWKDTILLKDVYNVALMLPLYLDLNDTLNRQQGLMDKPTIFEDALIGLTFYEGALMAIDSMKKAGINLKLFVYDTNNDTAVVRKLLQKPEMESMHLFIGPFYNSCFNLISAYARKQGINVACPVPQSNKILLGNPHVSKVASSIITQMEQMALFAFDKYYTENFILLNNDLSDETKYADIIKSKGIETLAKYSHLHPDTIKEIKCDKFPLTKGLSLLEEYLSPTKTNIILVPSTNQVLISDILTKLNPLTKDYAIVVFGMDKWKTFETLDINYLHNLSIHIPATNYTDYDDASTLHFIKQYKERFKAEPDKYGFLGFDVTYYYLNALKNFGVTFTQNLAEMKFDGISTSFDYTKKGIESGYENTHTYILKFEDYKLVKLK